MCGEGRGQGENRRVGGAGVRIKDARRPSADNLKVIPPEREEA